MPTVRVGAEIWCIHQTWEINGVRNILLQVLQTGSECWAKRSLSPSSLGFGIWEQYDFTSLGSFRCCVIKYSPLWFIMRLHNRNPSFLAFSLPPSLSPNCRGKLLPGFYVSGQAFSRRAGNRVIVSVVMCCNEVFSGFPIATSVPLLARWPIWNHLIQIIAPCCQHLLSAWTSKYSPRVIFNL